MDDEPRYMTPEQVAKQLQLSVSTVQDYAKRGLLPAVRFGRHWRFPVDDLRKLSEVTPRQREVIAR